MEEEEDIEFRQLLDAASESGNTAAPELETDGDEGHVRDRLDLGVRITIWLVVLMVLVGIGCMLYVLNPPGQG